jgi:cation:H+ antiporter
MTALLFIAGLVGLVTGGELLVRGAARLAAAHGIPPLVVGLTIVAFATSAPELAVSVRAALAGQADLAVGNAVGSNIFNVLLILGLSAAIAPLIVSRQLVRIDVPFMIAVSGALLLVALDGIITRGEAGLLVAALAAYLTLQVALTWRTGAPDAADRPAGNGTLLNITLIAAGLALLVIGADWLVEAAVAIAEMFGVTQLAIGLTIVAAGTSMPELATSIIAGVRGQRDIAVGNVVGSNIFNILAVLGIAGVIAPDGIGVSAAAVTLDIPVMIAAAVVCLPIFLTGLIISRGEGLLLLLYYLLYATYLVLDAGQHGGLQEYRYLLVTAVIPLTLLTVIGFGIRGLLDRPRR